MALRPTRRQFLESGAYTLVASAAWPTLQGHGRLTAAGEVSVATEHGTVQGAGKGLR